MPRGHPAERKSVPPPPAAASTSSLADHLTRLRTGGEFSASSPAARALEAQQQQRAARQQRIVLTLMRLFRHALERQACLRRASHRLGVPPTSIVNRYIMKAQPRVQKLFSRGVELTKRQIDAAFGFEQFESEMRWAHWCPCGCIGLVLVGPFTRCYSAECSRRVRQTFEKTREASRDRNDAKVQKRDWNRELRLRQLLPPCGVVVPRRPPKRHDRTTWFSSQLRTDRAHWDEVSQALVAAKKKGIPGAKSAIYALDFLQQAARRPR